MELAKVELRVPKLLLSAASGAGKTRSALRLMKGLIGDKSLVVIDTENRSSAINADKYEFYLEDLAPDKQNINGYIEALDKMVKEGMKGVILDGITPAWKDILEKANRMGGGFKDWAALTPLQDKFMKYIINYPLPLICTVRAKQEYIMETNDKGKAVVKKMGMASVQRGDIDYEFDIAFTIDQSTHKAKVDKCRYDEIELYFAAQEDGIILTEEIGTLIRNTIKGK